MKIWQKLTIGVMALIVAVLAVLLIRGLLISSGAGGGQPGEQNPIFPFESGGGDNFFGGGDDEDEEDETDTFAGEDILWQVTDSEVAGAAWVQQSPDDDPVLWHVLKENGHIYQSTETEREPTRIANTTIPGVQEALVASDGDFIVYRYLEDGVIKTYLGNLRSSPEGESRFRIDGTFLPDRLTQVSISPSGGKVFYLQPTTSGVAGVLYNTTTTEREVVWRSPVSQWRMDWSREGSISLTTAPARGVTGFSYRLNPESGEFRKASQGDALTTLDSPSGDFRLTGSYTNDRSYEAAISAINRTATSTTLTANTTADKCGWAQDVPAVFCGVPNDRITLPLKTWYQGRVSFTDQLYLLNPAQDTEVRLFGDEQLEKGPFDITHVTVDQDFNLLSFINKRDGSLWAFEL